jgi:hypothetical protein
MTRTFGWQRFYEAAILETKISSLPILIQTAEAAIHARLQQLGDDRENFADERQAIADAMAGIEVLKRELAETQTRPDPVEIPSRRETRRVSPTEGN